MITRYEHSVHILDSRKHTKLHDKSALQFETFFTKNVRCLRKLKIGEYSSIQNSIIKFYFLIFLANNEEPNTYCFKYSTFYHFT